MANGDYYQVYNCDSEYMTDWTAVKVDEERDFYLITYDAPHTPQEVSGEDFREMLKAADDDNATIREGYYELKDWTVEPAKDSAEYLEGPVPTKMKKLTDQEIDREMVKALNQMEGAMEILETLRKNAGDYGPKMGKGEAELWKAYSIISAKRPI